MTIVNGQIIKAENRAKIVHDLLVKRVGDIKQALPQHMSGERLLRVTFTSIRKTPGLMECKAESLLSCVLQCAQLGLEPDNGLGHAYLIPFRNRKRGYTECTLIIGYKGLVDLARRSGQISTISAYVVRDGDDFDYRLGLNPDIQHKPKADIKSDITHAYAVCRLKDGGLQFDVMTRAEIDAIRGRSRSSERGPWETDYAEMAKKTVLRRLFKLLPASIEIQRAVALDEQQDSGISQDLELSDLIPLPEKEETTDVISPSKQAEDDDIPDFSPEEQTS